MPEQRQAYSKGVLDALAANAAVPEALCSDTAPLHRRLIAIDGPRISDRSYFQQNIGSQGQDEAD